MALAAASDVTALAKILARRIATSGPLTLADYMAECLLHPKYGYYATRDPLGASGDFTTSPEISQIFGEMIGLCLAQCWIDRDRPIPFTLAELGPGRGTLMADIVRTIRTVPGMSEAGRIHFVEASPALRARQAQTLEGLEPTWHDRVDELPDGPLFLVANEFFDALPIRQFERREGGWAERQVALAGGALALSLGPVTDYPALRTRRPDTTPGDVVELCPALPAIAGDIAGRIAEAGGVALIVDYGDWRSLGDTFQAVRSHETSDPLATPGEADLTAHVDFEALSCAFRDAGAAATGMTPQGVFLERLGVTERARRLADRLSGSALKAHVAAHRRLTHPEEMGSLFKAIACYPDGTPPPPGLDPA
ncbi:hypothetical protein DEA8626_03990 [Defluviimonas aquaemixtae]|uniref:Uncharacterized protein n=1 Tax=Albidovulum aquaemixtae TaxID=1542388 RepID=A0A2R8BND7_9RHOB|nr:SAM-dependent methyltransferase [Defluviimonas aquaemixtae]SPH24957.1 hypothetical protein DEA8626_03990 [Defluviimonas aquaemixtae]